MNHRMATHCVIATVAVTLASAAHPQIAVPVTGEPHHHQVYSDTHVRSFSVEVPAHTSTLLHQHERDYVWVGLGAATFVNAVAGKAEVPVVAVNGSVHFSKGGFAHVARIDGEAPFRNVTIELLDPQTNPRNLCEAVVAGQPLHCPAGGDAMYRGASVRAAFATDQMRVSAIAIAPDGTLRVAASKDPRLLIPLQNVDESVTLTCETPGQRPSSRFRLSTGQGFTPPTGVGCAVRNGGRDSLHLLAMEFGDQGQRPR